MEVHLFRATGRVFGITPDSKGGPTCRSSGTLGQPMPGVEADECLDDIEAHGFHVTDAHVRISGPYV